MEPLSVWDAIKSPLRRSKDLLKAWLVARLYPQCDLAAIVYILSFQNVFYLH